MALNPKHLSKIQPFLAPSPVSAKARQVPLRQQYEVTPAAAWVEDCARTSDADVPATHPIHAHVVCGEGVTLNVPVSVHQAVGGESDFPCPGELLAASLASCLDTAIRMIANLTGIELKRLSVHASLSADVRGTLKIGQNIPVGFQRAVMSVDLEAADNLPEAQMSALLDAAERSCVILQTFRAPPQVQVERSMGPCGARQ